MRLRILHRLIALSFGVIPICSHSESRFFAVDLGSHRSALALSDNGRIVGYQTGKQDIFVRAVATQPKAKAPFALGSFGGETIPMAVNRSGQVAGGAGTEDGTVRAFIASPGSGELVDLGTLGGNSSDAVDINAAGQVVGKSQAADGMNHAFVTGPNGGALQDLGTLGGTYSEAVGINDRGQIAALATSIESLTTRSFLVDPGSGITRDIGTLGGNVFAFCINATGQVAGGADNPDLRSLSFMTDADGKNIHAIKPAGSDGWLTAINASGHAVGIEVTFPFRYDAVGTFDGRKNVYLRDLVDNIPDNIHFLSALDINDHDEILVTASDRHSYLLVPRCLDRSVHCRYD